MPVSSNISRPAAKADDAIRIQDLYYLCLARWKWFVLSLAVCLGFTVIYLLKTPPVYTRTASLLIKEDSKGQSMSGDIGAAFSDLGLFQSRTNVNNELISLKSPAVMYDVVKRLHLEVDYTTEGHFYPQVRYGRNLPLTVTFVELADNESASLVVEAVRPEGIRLTAFIRNGEELDGTVVGALNDTLNTPVGKLVVRAATAYHSWQEQPELLTISRSPLNAAVSRYSGGLEVALNNEKATILDLSFRDVCIQRAEEENADMVMGNTIMEDENHWRFRYNSNFGLTAERTLCGKEIFRRFFENEGGKCTGVSNQNLIFFDDTFNGLGNGLIRKSRNNNAHKLYAVQSFLNVTGYHFQFYGGVDNTVDFLTLCICKFTEVIKKIRILPQANRHPTIGKVRSHRSGTVTAAKNCYFHPLFTSCLL